MNHGTIRNRLVLIALFGLFFAPMLAAVLLHSRWIAWQAPPEKAHGELIQPVEPLGPFQLDDAFGQPRTLDDLKGLWQLAHARRGACGDACLERLVLMHNIRLSQDRHRDEVGLLLVTDHDIDAAVLDELRALDPSWLVFAGRAGERLLDRFPGEPVGAFYIVDPEANIMERFGPHADLDGVRKDLDRLVTWTVREQ